MSLKAFIEEINFINTDHSQPQHAADQAESLKSLSHDLYTDDKRFVYELLQNADDSALPGSKVKVAVRIFGEQLVIAHTGKVFDEADVNGVCGVNAGSKKSDSSKTGYKGIGFKAVFSQSNCVTVYTGGEYFRFDAEFEYGWKASWKKTQVEWEKQTKRKFSFPWQIIPIYALPEQVNHEIHSFLKDGDWTVATILTLFKPIETLQAVKSLTENVNMYLFLKNVNHIDFDVAGPITISIQRETPDEIILSSTMAPASKWLINTVELDIPFSIREKLAKDKDFPEKLQQAEKMELTLASKIGEQGIEAVPSIDRLLYSYLPTDEKRYSFPVLVNTGFLTTSNRESLHTDSYWNVWLFQSIACELFKWMGKLVLTDYGIQAYNLLPQKINLDDALSVAFNNAFDHSINTIPFILSTEGELLKVKETIIDFTFLSEEEFIGKEAIKNYVEFLEAGKVVHARPFVPFTGAGRKFKGLGAAAFEWANVPAFLISNAYLPAKSPENDQKLVSHLKRLAESEKPKELKDEVLKGWSFLMDHKDQMKSPGEIFFPAPDDDTWNSPESELSFLHPDLQTWLLNEGDLRIWLETLGVVEKTDITYLEKTIIPNSKTYCTVENAVDTIRTIYNLYKKNDINDTHLKKLNELKLLTRIGGLVTAADCYLSDTYVPTLPLGDTLTADIFVSESYLPPGADIPEWKRFFKIIGVQDTVSLQSFNPKITEGELSKKGIKDEYLEAPDKKFYGGAFTADKYANLASLYLLHQTNQIAFSRLFWDAVIKGIPAQPFLKTATAYWGYGGYSGATTGAAVANYLAWYVREYACLPTLAGTLQKAGEIFAYSEDLEKIGDGYLPVFFKEISDPNWRAFFGFKNNIELPEYLYLLTKFSEDVNDQGKVKQGNKARIQAIYTHFLENITNWSADELQLVNTWSQTGALLNQDDFFTPCNGLKYYADGDTKIFQGAYPFMALASARNHPDLETLLQLLGVEVLKQSAFEITGIDVLPASEFSAKFKSVIPYLASWTQNHVSGRYDQRLYELEQYFSKYTFYQGSSLNIVYGENFKKPINVHVGESKIYMSTPWSSNTVMLTLPKALALCFDSKNYEAQIQFLLKAEEQEIVWYFNEQAIPLPPSSQPEKPEEEPQQDPTPEQHEDELEKDFRQPTDYEGLWAATLDRNEALIAAVGNDPKNLLLEGLQSQHPGKGTPLYHFTHVENAVKIINEGLIKSRATADFLDSAGQGIISQTDEERKKFARFYFRTKTPTQYHVENWGTGDGSRISGNPVCPIPVFFIFDLKEVIERTEWKVSLGTMASAQVKFGNDLEILSRFDFDGIYKDKWQLPHDRFMVAAHQEFLVPDQLDISKLSITLGVQDKAAKDCLIAMLGGGNEWNDIIQIKPELYRGQNPHIKIEENTENMSASFDASRPGVFVFQTQGLKEWHHITADHSNQYLSQEKVTITSKENISITGSMSEIKYNLYYFYKGRLWLVHTNHNKNTYDLAYIREPLVKWLATEPLNENSLFQILKIHPVLKYWYKQSVGGPDGFLLEGHTKQVISNYLSYFKGKQEFFESDQIFLIFLALHDIGKPLAIGLGNKELQHEESLKILDNIREALPVSDEVFKQIKDLINGDPIGEYMNPKYNLSLDEASAEIMEMANRLNIDVKTFWKSLVIFYQCDSGSYKSLKNRLFLLTEDQDFSFNDQKSRFLFNEGLESKFVQLEKKFI
jgi:hypothetical protein